MIEFENVGGLVMPVILDIEYGDGSREEMRLPAELWRQDPEKVKKLIMTQKEIAAITVDPHIETADGNLDNNHWPRKPIQSRFQLFKQKRPKNPMQKAKEAEEKAAEEKDGKKRKKSKKGDESK